MKRINKLGNIICSLLLVAVFLVTGITVANAASTATINREGVMVSYIGENYKWGKFRTSDGKIAYCMDLEKKWPEKTTNVTLTSKDNAGLRYILENGYPYKSIKGNSDLDRFITQAAVWWYLSDTNQTSKLSADFTTNAADPYNIRGNIQALVNGAKNAKAQATASLNVTVGNNKLNLSSDKKYYVSSEMSTSLVGASTYNVALNNAPKGTIVTNTNGQAQTAFKAGEKFLVKIPVNAIGKTTSLSVRVSAVAANAYARIYQPSDTSYQRLVALYPENTNLSKTINLTAEVKPEDEKVCVDYVIVGNTKPAEHLTDPTPGKVCYDKGTKYTQEKQLTTRQENCKFNGWYTKSDLTGKWTDGTALNKDMTLYGAWDCGTSINVPNTAANLSLMILGVGIVVIGAGVGIVLYRNNKNAKATK